MSVSRAKVARKPARPSTKSRPVASEQDRLNVRARVEARLIASALRKAPVLHRERVGREVFPFNNVASADAMSAAIDKIVRGRIPESPWIAAHQALMRTDENGRGYAEYVDAFRDVSFMAGVDYALRSLPSWWSALAALPEHEHEALMIVIKRTIRVFGQDAGGTR